MGELMMTSFPPQFRAARSQASRGVAASVRHLAHGNVAPPDICSILGTGGRLGR